MPRNTGATLAGLVIPAMTPAQITKLVADYGPAGVIEVNGLQVGSLVRDSTAALSADILVFDGTAFVVIALTPDPTP